MTGVSADCGSRDLRQTEPAPDPRGPSRPTADDCKFATAAEQMFFHGAPLAHVVAYCEHMRMTTIRRRNKLLSRRIAG